MAELTDGDFYFKFDYCFVASLELDAYDVSDPNSANS